MRGDSFEVAGLVGDNIFTCFFFEVAQLVGETTVIFFFLKVAVLVRNTVEELFNKEALQNHIENEHANEAFSCEVIAKPLVATSCAFKVSTFSNKDFSDKDYDNLVNRQNQGKAVVGMHLLLEDQTKLFLLGFFSLLVFFLFFG